MAQNAVFSICYAGAVGMGFGIFKVEDGKFVGRDYAGGSYEGSVQELDDGRNSIDIVMTVPAGVILAFGASAQEVAHQRPVRHIFPADWGDGRPETIEVSGMQLNVMIKRLPDDFHDARKATVQGFHLALND